MLVVLSIDLPSILTVGDHDTVNISVSPADPARALSLFFLLALKKSWSEG